MGADGGVPRLSRILLSEAGKAGDAGDAGDVSGAGKADKAGKQAMWTEPTSL